MRHRTALAFHRVIHIPLSKRRNYIPFIEIKQKALARRRSRDTGQAGENCYGKIAKILSGAPLPPLIFMGMA